MPLSITSVTSATTQSWQLAVDSCDYATFFHTPQWADIFSRTSAGAITPAAQALLFSDGRRALVSCCRRRLAGLLSSTLSSPAGTYGGWIAAEPLTKEHGTLLRDFLLSCPNLRWRANPFDPLLRTCVLPQGTQDFTQALDLRQGLAAIERRCTPAHRKAINKALRAGIGIHTAATLPEWREHFRLYQQSVSRWRKINLGLRQNQLYDWNLFKIIFDLNLPACRLWQARNNDTTIASILCFYHNRHAVTWHGVADAEGLALRPNNLLYDAIMRDAHERGFWWMDFNPSGGHAGVVEFKSNLGAEKIASSFIVQSSGLRKFGAKLKTLFFK